MDELTRLRALVQRLEFAGQLYHNVPCCPVCEVGQWDWERGAEQHKPDCELAAALGRMLPGDEP